MWDEGVRGGEGVGSGDGVGDAEFSEDVGVFYGVALRGWVLGGVGGLVWVGYGLLS